MSKLEKADILELTVRHLHRLRRPRDAAEDAHRFQVCTVQSRGLWASDRECALNLGVRTSRKEINPDMGFLGYLTWFLISSACRLYIVG